MYCTGASTLLPPSGPARDLWIEMSGLLIDCQKVTSGPARDLWIEIKCSTIINGVFESGPARDLWIEIYKRRESASEALVGSRKGPVD